MSDDIRPANLIATAHTCACGRVCHGEDPQMWVAGFQAGQIDAYNDSAEIAKDYSGAGPLIRSLILKHRETRIRKA